MNICVTVNSQYMRYLYVMLLSLFYCNKQNDIHLFVVSSDFTENDKNIVASLVNKWGGCDFINISSDLLYNLPAHKKERSDLSVEIYYRLLLPDYIPAYVDRLLMLDVDIVVNCDLSELYNVDFEDKYFAAAPNMCHNLEVPPEWRRWYDEGRKDWTHYNTGVLMWNLAKIRQELPSHGIYKLAWKYHIETSTFEEELFNVEFGEKNIKSVPCEKYNYITTHIGFHENPRYKIYGTTEEIEDNCAIVHYAALNPWHAGVKNDSFKLWWKWAKESPFYAELSEEYRNICDNEIKIQYDKIVDVERQTQYLAYQCRLNDAKLILIDSIVGEKNHKHIIDELQRRGINECIIYGAGRIGGILSDTLSFYGIKVLYFIDKNFTGRFCNKEVVCIKAISSPRKFEPIIISNPYHKEEILTELSPLSKGLILSLDELLPKEQSNELTAI